MCFYWLFGVFLMRILVITCNYLSEVIWTFQTRILVLQHNTTTTDQIKTRPYYLSSSTVTVNTGSH